MRALAIGGFSSKRFERGGRGNERGRRRGRGKSRGRSGRNGQSVVEERLENVAEHALLHVEAGVCGYGGVAWRVATIKSKKGLWR